MTDLNQIKSASDPMLAIDLDRSEIVIANPSAQSALRLPDEDQFPLPLDSSMPALVRMRDLKDQKRMVVPRELLVFWWRSRPVASLCKLEFSETGHGKGVVSIRLLSADGHQTQRYQPVSLPKPPLSELATTGNAQTANRSQTQQEEHGDWAEFEDVPATPHDQPQGTSAPESEPESRELPRRERNDTDTLAKIARDIRSGLKGKPQGTPQLAPPAATESGPPQQVETATKTMPARNTAMTPENPAGDDHDALSGIDLAKLAHELKTPLTAISAASEIMRDQRLGTTNRQRYQEYASDIHEASQHALSLIRTMLQNDQDQSDEPASTSINLNDCVRQTVSMLKPLALKRDINLEYELEPGAPLIFGDLTSLRQILINLLNNALKFTPDGGEVRAVTGYLDSSKVFLVVRDTGNGMDQSALAAARDTKADTPHPRPGGGYGIGLPIVYKLVRELSGEIEFDSQPGHGTVAMVTFNQVAKNQARRSG